MIWKIPNMLMLTVLCRLSGLVWTKDEPDCFWTEHYCPSTDKCVSNSIVCDGQCGYPYHFCPSTNTCIDESTPCDGKCPEHSPNLCDNGTLCYPNSYINDRVYNCVDRSDEHRHVEKHPPLDNSNLDKFLLLKAGVDEYDFPGIDCQDGTVHPYLWWCREEYHRMCGGVSTTDYLICSNSSLWRGHPCGEEIGQVRGCKMPGKCIDEDDKCDVLHRYNAYECGASDYSDEVCPVNEDNVRENTRYFRCNDNSSLIHPTLVCDGFKHCEDGSDENECDICPRVNNMVVHGQVIQLKAEEIRDFFHLKSTAIMKCESPYGQAVCATPGDGTPECAIELKEGFLNTQDEIELTPARLWRTIFKYMAYIFLISLVFLVKVSQLGDICQRSTVDVPILISYRRTIPLCDEPLPLAISMRSLTLSDSSFPTPFFTTTEPMQLTQQFRQYYIQNHRSDHFEEFFNFCLTLSKFLTTPVERDIFHCGIYALEAQIHGMSPTCTDRCLKQHSSDALQPMFDAVYGSLSDRFPNKVKNILYTKDKLPCFNYFCRIKTFAFRFFFFYYDIVQEYVLLSFILGTAGLGISTTFWIKMSDFSYIHIMIYLYISSVFLPIILFAIQLTFSSKIGVIFGIKKPSVGQKIFLGLCCFLLSPFIPTVLFFMMEKNQMKMFNYAKNTSKSLNALNYEDITTFEFGSLKQKVVGASKILMDTHSEIIEAKSLYKHFKEWELAIEMPIQSTLVIIFSFMKKSTTVVNQVFQNWFISDAASLVFLVGMSLRSIIAVQISDESARRNNFLGMKSKIFLAPLYMMTSIPRIASMVIYAAVPLGLMDLLGHWTAETQGNRYHDFHINESRLMNCIKENGYNATRIEDTLILNIVTYSSTVFDAEVRSTKYTMWNTLTYMGILTAVLATLVIINFVWLCVKSRKSFSEKCLSSAKSVLCITLHSDFDEDDESIRPDQLHLYYKDKFDKVHKEYFLKLLLHSGTNVALTFPWAMAYQAANKRHQILMEIGDCYGVKGTVEMEDISLERLWWGQWVLPLLMAIVGVLNYGWFRLYIKYGHPWRRLLTLDKERIKEWRTLKLWEILENKNDNGGDAENRVNLSIQESVSAISVGDNGSDVMIDVTVNEVNQEADSVNQEADSTNSTDEFYDIKFNTANEDQEGLLGDEVEVDVLYHKGKQEENAINRKDESYREDVILKKYGCMTRDRDMHLLKDDVDLQVKIEDEPKRKEQIYKLKLENNCIHIKEEIGNEIVSVEDDNWLQIVYDDNNRTIEIVKENASLENNYCAIERLHKNSNKEESLDNENGLLGGDLDIDLVNKERNKCYEKENMSVYYNISVETLCNDRNKSNEIERENVSLEKSISKVQLDNDNNEEEVISKENISIDDYCCVELLKVQEVNKDEIYKGTFEQGDNNSDRDRNKQMLKENYEQESKNRDKEEESGKENKCSVDDFYLELVGNDGNKEELIHRRKVKKENDGREKEYDLLKEHVFTKDNICVNVLDDDENNHEQLFREHVQVEENEEQENNDRYGK